MTAPGSDPHHRARGMTEWETAWEMHKARDRAERRRQGPVLRAMLRGFLLRCPRCGEGRVLKGFLAPSPGCGHCAEPYDHIRTDDFAPWLGIFVIGHVLVPLAILVETLFSPPLWVHIALWLPVGFEMVLIVLPRAKGLALGLMWALRLRGDEHQH